MSSTFGFEGSCTEAWRPRGRMEFTCVVWSQDGRHTALVSFDARAKETDDARPARPAGFVLTFQAAAPDDCSIVVKTFADKFREVCQTPGPYRGQTFRQIDEPGPMVNVAGRKMHFPSRMAEKLQGGKFPAGPNIACQFIMRKMIEELRRKGVSP